jgi:photosystem II stability/assembly factor-like uncharacterized protein
LLSSLLLIDWSNFILTVINRLRLMSYRSLLRIVVCSLFFLVMNQGKAAAQWSLMSSGLIGQGPYGNQGAMGAGGGIAWAGLYKLYRSSDQGKTWKQSSLPMPSTEMVNYISFFDATSGLVSTSNGLYVTHDSGTTWTQFFSGEYIFSAVFSGAANTFVAGSLTTHQICFTTDNGQNWKRQTVSNVAKDLYSNKPGSVIAFIEDAVSSFVTVTTDYGTTWTKRSGTMECDAHGFGVSGCDANVIFGINEEGGNYHQDDSYANIYRSSDGGNSFSNINQFPLASLAGCILITPGIAYVPTRTSGFLESTDNGLSWTTAQGPTFAIDCRDIIVVDDTVLLAADQQGSIWRTIDTRGLKSSSQDQQLILSAVSATLMASGCKPADINFTLSFSGCQAALLDSEWVIGSTSFAIVKPLVPHAIGVDSITIRYQSGTNAHDTAQLHIQYTIGATTRDTTILLLGVTTGSGGKLSYQHLAVRGAAYQQQITIPMLEDMADSADIRANWNQLKTITATVTFDPSRLAFTSYLPPNGWMLQSTNPSASSLQFVITNLSASPSAPLDLGSAVFQIVSSNIGLTRVILSNLDLAFTSWHESVCLGDGEDNLWGIEIQPAGVTQESPSPIRVFPNPVADRLIVESDDVLSSVQLFDVLGRSVTEVMHRITAGYDIVTTSLPPGTYTLICYRQGTASSFRITKR